MVFDIYKRGQGKYTRLGSAFGVTAVAGLGCAQLYKVLEASDWGLWIETMAPAGLFVILVALVFWLVNTPGVANFMIAAEGEMKKVSWSSRKEVAVSTSVVIVVVVALGVLFYVTDMTFRMFFDWLIYGS
jgi:preprotein translocase SecE subunit